MRHLLIDRSAILAIGLATLLATSATASAQALDRIKGSGNLNLGYIDQSAPFSVAAGDNAPSGYSIDLCQHIANAVKETVANPGLNVRFIPIKAEDVVSQLSSGGIDLLCTAASDTLERRASMSFSIPVFNGGVGVLVRADADEALMNVLNGRVAISGPKWRAAINGGLANKTFVVFSGSVSEKWVRQRIQRLGVVATIITVDDNAKGIALVDQHQADAYFGERVFLQSYVSQGDYADRLKVVDRIYTYEPLALAMARNDDDFRLVVDTALSQLYLIDEFSGLYASYFGAFDDNAKRLFLTYALH
jgi:polar amino acid transport system substrate-binding protein